MLLLIYVTISIGHNLTAVEVSTWMDNYILWFHVFVLTYLCWFSTVTTIVQ